MKLTWDAPLLNREGTVSRTFGFSSLTTSKQANNGATCWIWVPHSPSSLPILVHKKYNFNNRVKFNYSLSPSLLPFLLDFPLAFVDSIEAWRRRRTVAGWWFCCFVSSTNLQRRTLQSRPCRVSTISPRCLVITFHSFFFNSYTNFLSYLQCFQCNSYVQCYDQNTGGLRVSNLSFVIFLMPYV